MLLILEQAWSPVLGALGGPILVAAGGLVVVLAILLVFLMVLRSNGDARKMSSGFGHDGQQGAPGQPRAPMSQPQQSWGPEGMYGAPANAPANAPASAAPNSWGAQPQAPGGWGEQNGPAAGANWGAPAPNGWGNAPANVGGTGNQWQEQNAWAAPAAPQAPQAQQPGGWGATPAPQAQQPGSWGATPAAGGWSEQQAPAAGGWGAPNGQDPNAWGAPNGQDPNAWSEQQVPAAGGWGEQNGADAGANWGAPAPAANGWGNAPANVPTPGGWAAPAATAQGGQDWNMPANGPMGQPAGYGGPAGAAGMGYAARPAQRMGVLLVRQGKEPGRTFEMRKDRTTIGRSRDSDVFLEDLAVSRLHTTIGRDETGRYVLHDENSANGTFVNGQRVAERVLEEGDEVQVGQTILTFVRR